jgi:chorismate synthase
MTLAFCVKAFLSLEKQSRMVFFDMIRYLTAGESHGPALTGIVEGMPAGVPLELDAINKQLARRQQGYGRGGRMLFEEDAVSFSSGVRFGKTMGGPVAMHMPNKAHAKDRDNWQTVLSAVPVDVTVEKITLPRPGHADLVGTRKYGQDDIRPSIERSSARETAMRVACGAVARAFLRAVGIHIGGHVIRLGAVGYESWDAVRAATDNGFSNAEALGDAADDSEVRCLDATLSEAMQQQIRDVKKKGGSLGGVYEIIITGVPEGLGSYVHWDRKLDGLLAQAIVATQAMKGVEFGLGFESGALAGFDVHDEIFHDGSRFRRKTNRAGGLEGGMTTGEPIIIRGVMKPIPTMLNPLMTVDIHSLEPQPTRYERSDVCALPRAVVVAENVIAPVIANAFLEKFGGDHLDEILSRLPGNP